MRRELVIALCVGGMLAAAGGSARAERTYRVVISTQPQGANVFLGDNEGSPVGESPYDGKLPKGEHTIFLELEDHEPIVDQIHVEKSRKPQLFKFEFEEIIFAHVTIEAEDDDENTKGAAIVLDGEWAGTVPETLKVRGGPHQLEIVEKGFARYEKWIEVVEGERSTVAVKLERPSAGAKIKKKKKVVVRGQPYLVAVAALELGWRNWAYDNPQSESARPFSASYVPMFRLDAEFFPMAAKTSAIRGASLHFKAGLGLPPAAKTSDGTAIDTAWNEVEGGFRFTHTTNPTYGAAVGAEISIGRVAFEFGDAGPLTGETPDVDYRFVRYGVHGAYLAGEQRIYGGAGFLRISSAGEMVERFRSATAGGFDVYLGYSRRILNKLDVRSSFTYRGFIINLESEPGDLIEADGGSDKYYLFQIGAAYSL